LQGRIFQIYAADPGRYFYPDQYNNPANWKAHFDGTAPEIIEQTASHRHRQRRHGCLIADASGRKVSRLATGALVAIVTNSEHRNTTSAVGQISKEFRNEEIDARTPQD
jgi:hypothetical protein